MVDYCFLPKQSFYRLSIKGYGIHVINFNLVEGIGCHVFCRLFEVSDSCGVGEFLDNCFQSIIAHNAFFFPKPHAIQHLWQGKLGEDDFLFFRRVVRNINDSETGHQRCADLVFVIGCRDWIDAACRNHTFNIVVGKAQIIK